jgi:O-antigen/teichoic acid export membrane protein
MADVGSARDNQIGRSVFRSTFSNLLGNFIVLGFGFFLTPFLLNHLGQDQYGLWTLFGVVIGYGAMLDLGVSAAVIKYLSEHRARGEHEAAQQIVSTALRFFLVMGVIAIALGILFAPNIAGIFQVRPEDQAVSVNLILLALVISGLSLPWLLNNAILRGLHRFDLVNVVTVTGSLFYWAGMVTVLLTGGGLLLMGLVHLVMIFIMTFISAFLIRRVAPGIRLEVRSANRSLLSKMLTYSIALFVLAIASLIQTQIDEVVIGAFLPIAMITPYFLARRLSEIPETISDQFMRVILPIASELNAENDHDRLRTLYLTSTRLTLVGYVPVAAILIVLSRSILTTWVGAEYGQYNHLLIILVVAGMVGVSQYPAGAMLQGLARHKTLAFSSSASALINLGLSLLLIGPFGITGVAIGTLVPRVLESLGYVLPFTLHVMQVKLVTAVRKMILPALVPALPMCAALYTLDQALRPDNWLEIILISGLGMIIYAGTYLVFGAAQREREAYRSIAFELLGKAQKYFAQP